MNFETFYRHKRTLQPLMIVLWRPNVFFIRTLNSKISVQFIPCDSSGYQNIAYKEKFVIFVQGAALPNKDYVTASAPRRFQKISTSCLSSHAIIIISSDWSINWSQMIRNVGSVRWK